MDAHTFTEYKMNKQLGSIPGQISMSWTSKTCDRLVAKVSRVIQREWHLGRADASSSS